MKANIGTIDKSVRIILAAIIAVLYFTDIISGTVGIILLVVSAILLLTSFLIGQRTYNSDGCTGKSWWRR